MYKTKNINIKDFCAYLNGGYDYQKICALFKIRTKQEFVALMYEASLFKGELLHFNIPEEPEDYNDTLKETKYWDIAAAIYIKTIVNKNQNQNCESIFRIINKHGFKMFKTAIFQNELDSYHFMRRKCVKLQSARIAKKWNSMSRGDLVTLLDYSIKKNVSFYRTSHNRMY